MVPFTDQVPAPDAVTPSKMTLFLKSGSVAGIVESLQILKVWLLLRMDASSLQIQITNASRSLIILENVNSDLGFVDELWDNYSVL
jgi:hypothetical protein